MEVQELAVSGSQAHPVHVHVNHMQVQPGGGSLNGSLAPAGWHQVGDWLDTISAASSGDIPIVRFRADDFYGFQMVHCHVLRHGDGGAMNMFYVSNTDGAKDYNFTDSMQNYKQLVFKCPA